MISFFFFFNSINFFCDYFERNFSRLIYTYLYSNKNVIIAETTISNYFFESELFSSSFKVVKKKKRKKTEGCKNEYAFREHLSGK